MTNIKPIKQKEKDLIIQALAAGVVPRSGLQHIQVGRSQEVLALVKDIDRITEGGCALRFIIGEYGAGKTFFLNLIRLIALEHKLVTIHADLAPDRRLHATNGQARSLYSEAIRNMATRTKPDGGALQSIVERFITECAKESSLTGKPVESIIDAKLISLHEQVGGYDFSTVLKAYWKAGEQDDETTKAAALRWLKGEYSTKTEARTHLEIRNIIDDANVYDSIKLLSSFVKLAGYSGLIVVFDEMVNLYKLQNSQARNQNYEQILRMLNDVLQGGADSLGFIFGGTPEFLMDTRRGLYSYQALQSRLSENSFAKGGLIDFSGPVIRLQRLTVEELYILLGNIRNIFALGNSNESLIPDEAMQTFMEHCNKRIGEAYFQTPRNTIKAFVQMLAVLEQNPDASWQELVGGAKIESEDNFEMDSDNLSEDDDDLTSLKL